MVSFENVLTEIDDFGIYQKIRYLLICFAALLPPIGNFILKNFLFMFENKLFNSIIFLVAYTHSFIASNPSHRLNLIFILI